MKDDWEELHQQVKQIIDILDKYAIVGWSKKLVEINNRISKRWKEGPSLFLEAMGGMGSLTDLTIYPENNDKIDKIDVDRVNQTLSKKISWAYVLAKQIEKTISLQ